VLFRLSVFWLHLNYTVSNRNTSFHIVLLFSTDSIQDFHTILCTVLFCSTIYMKHFLTRVEYPQKVMQINNHSLNEHTSHACWNHDQKKKPMHLFQQLRYQQWQHCNRVNTRAQAVFLHQGIYQTFLCGEVIFFLWTLPIILFINRVHFGSQLCFHFHVKESP